MSYAEAEKKSFEEFVRVRRQAVLDPVCFEDPSQVHLLFSAPCSPPSSQLSLLSHFLPLSSQLRPLSWGSVFSVRSERWCYSMLRTGPMYMATEARLALLVNMAMAHMDTKVTAPVQRNISGHEMATYPIGTN